MYLHSYDKSCHSYDKNGARGYNYTYNVYSLSNARLRLHVQPKLSAKNNLVSDQSINARRANNCDQRL